MGNANSSQNIMLMDQNYTYQALKLHPVFGEIKIYKHCETGRRIATINKQIFESQQQSFNQETFQKRKSYNHPNLLKILGFSKQVTNDLCSTIKYLSIQIEYYENELLQFKDKYIEKELYYLIFTLCETMEYCKQNQNDITDLHPQKILVTDDGYIKLVDNIISIEAISNFHQVKYNDRQVEYLAPEQLELFTGQKVKVNQEKANVFCLGLLIASLIIRQPASDYYLEEFVNLGLLFKRLDQKFQQNHFSSGLYNFIKDMLALDPEERLSYKQIIAKKQYHHFVSNLDGDSIDYADNQQNQESILESHHEQQQQQFEEQKSFHHKKKESVYSVRQSNNEESMINDSELNKRIEKALAESNKLLDTLDASSPVTKLQSKAIINGIFDSVQNPLVQLTDSRIKRLLDQSEKALQRSELITIK